MKKLGVALLGLGTVGGGTYRILTENRERIKKEYGLDISVECVIEKNKARAEALGVDPSIVSTDIDDVILNPRIEIVAEFFGGIEPARSFLIASLKAGKSIVTANKELFSKHWSELETAAEEGKAGLYFEATCAGGIPIIRTLCDSMQANNILSIKGIINGTTNFILSKMNDEGADYGETLKVAQDLGYAEANPVADVEGYDASYKLSILSSLAFHKNVPVDKIYREGITNITKEDIAFGKEFGLTIKLLGISKIVNGKIEARVHPVFIPDDHPLAGVKGSFNAVYVTGDAVGDIMLYGRGAGDLPTGSAIVSDIVYAGLSKEHKRFPQVLQPFNETDFVEDFECEYYLRMQVYDKPGIMSQITGIFGKYNVSITTMLQKSGQHKVPITFVTHKTSERSIKAAIEEITKIDGVAEVSSMIRVER